MPGSAWRATSAGSTEWQVVEICGQGIAAASADTAAAAPATYDQAQVQAMLTELRDLKTKMRTARLLS